MFQILNVLVLVVLEYFLPLGMPHCSGLILQLSSEEMTLSENARNVLMDMKEEEEAILVAAKDTKL